MTDLLSKPEVSKDTEVMADMAGELIHAKMEANRNSSQMTHVMRIGTFHMQLVPDGDIDVKDMFNEMLDKLIEKYGEKLLEINVHTAQEEKGRNRHYG